MALERRHRGRLEDVPRKDVWPTNRPIPKPIVCCDIIREARLRAGLTLEHIAERIGCSWQTVHYLENPKRSNPTVKTLQRFADALGMELRIELR